MSNSIFALIMLSSLLGVSSLQEANIQKNIKPKNHVGSGSQTLRLINVEDYIFEDEEDESNNLIHQFEAFAREQGYENVKVEYNTTDTPESMFNSVKLAPNGYDLICPSDYMIQKLIVNDMIEPMRIDEEHMPHYVNMASKAIKGRLDNISAVNAKTGEECFLKDYAVGYMWGTLGILFDPTYGGRDADQTIYDMQEWSALWNPDYKGISSIKDSVRDTYAIGLLYALDEDFLEDNKTVEGFRTLRNKYLEGSYTAEEYNAKFSELFNKCDAKTLEKVRKALSKLKGNVFGMEVDSGKQDIITGKIGINFAWSGDAVYSMSQAEEERELELCYSIPKTGSNLWMDAWCMPKSSSRSEAQKELAELFLDFLSTPEITAQNMEYTGYTPFTAGNDILDLTRAWYDYRYNEETEEFNDVQYTEAEMEELGLQKVDLSYFFKGTLTDEYADDENACIFYSDCYLPYSYENEDGEVEENNCVGREFFCQFPDEETITRCAVMRDFGAQNEAVLKMWEKFKSDALPVWAIILFVVEGALIISALIYFIVRKKTRQALRRKRIEAERIN